MEDGGLGPGGLLNELLFITVYRYSQWWSTNVWESLPQSAEERRKGCDDELVVVKTMRDDERVDHVWEFYKPFEMTSFDTEFINQMPNSIRSEEWFFVFCCLIIEDSGW